MKPVPGPRLSVAANLSSRRRLLLATCRAVALYAFAAWVYVALVALIQPQTLSLRLTHLASWPRTDTFGEVSFVVSFVAFWAYTVLRPPRPPFPADPGRAYD
jgi:hypothetical protein